MSKQEILEQIEKSVSPTSPPMWARIVRRLLAPEQFGSSTSSDLHRLNYVRQRQGRLAGSTKQVIDACLALLEVKP